MPRVAQAEYIWLDGAAPTQQLRSKAKIIVLKEGSSVSLKDFPDWAFDGSSTYQATGKNSDLLLKPVNFVGDPLRGEGNYLVMCEVLNTDGTPHATNKRTRLRKILIDGAAK